MTARPWGCPRKGRRVTARFRRGAAAGLAALAAAGWPGPAPPAGAQVPAAPGLAAPRPGAALDEAARKAFEGDLDEALALLRPVAADAAAPEPVRARAAFLLGALLLRAARPAEAAAALEAAAGDRLVGDYALARLAQARRAEGDPRGSARALARLLVDHVGSPLADTAWRDLGRAAADAGDLPSAEGALREALSRSRGGTARAEIQWLLAEVLVRAGRPAEAAPLLRDIGLGTPAAREADRALELLAALPGAAPLADDERFQRAMRLYRGGAHARAARELVPFAEGTGPHAAQARLALGIARFHAREYQDTIRTLEPLLGDPAAGGRAEVQFWVARAHGRLGDRVRFLALLEDLVATAPRHRRADEALFFLAAGYIGEGRRDRAADAYERLMRHYPQSDRFDGAQWGKAWLAYRDGRHARAAKTFHKLGARAAGWWAQATYWEGRALEGAGRPAEARGLYAQVARGYDAYYGRLARARLAGAPEALPAAPPQPAASPGAPLQRDRLAVARAVAELWLADEAAEEYGRLVRDHPEDRGLVAEAVAAFLRLQRMDKAVGVARRVLWPQYVQAGGAPPIPAFWDALYPQGYWNVVLEKASRRRLDPFLVLAIIREESAFAPQAVSPAGARGLMQVMPFTATRLAGAHGLPPPGAGASLEEPRYNIALGTAELADLLAEFKGDLVPALAAYNAGPHHVRRWIQERGYAGPEEFVEEIPFDETRTYVKRVLGTFGRYRALYAATAPSSNVQGPPSTVTNEASGAGGR